MSVNTDSSSFRRVYIPGVFVFAAFLAYSNILGSYFLSDDFAQIGKVLSGDRSVVWGQAHGGFFRPLFILSYIIDSSIWGARPFGYHATNVVFHALNSFLVYIFSLRLSEHIGLPSKTKERVSLAAALIFLLHPSHTEVVSWISGRADVMATFFCLASLLWWLTYAKRARILDLGLSLACFALSLLAKESAICLPLLVLVIALSRPEGPGDGKSFRLTLKTVAPFFLILLAFIMVRGWFLGTLVGGYGVGQHLNFSPGWLRDRLLQAALRSVLPALPSQWSTVLLKPLQSRVFILLAAICSALIASTIVIRRRWYTADERKRQNRFLLVLVFLFLFSLLPVINLRLSLYETQGERFIYLASVFSSLMLSYLLVILIRNRKLFAVVLICLLGFYSTTLYLANRIWREAAQLSRSIKEDVTSAATRRRLLVLNAPDNLRGVPVYHNGLPEAIKYFSNQKQIDEVEIISFQNLQTVPDRVQLLRNSESLDLNLLNDNENFDRVTASDCVSVLQYSRKSLGLRLKPCAADTDFFFFDSGRLVKIPD